MNARLCHLCLIITLFVAFASQSAAQIFPALHAYETCTFDDGLQIVDIASLASGVTSRPVKTRKDTMFLKMVVGRRVMFAYPDTDFYANVKVEVLPLYEWPTEKQIVLDGLDYTLASDAGNTRNYDLPSKLNGLEAHGFDRSKLEGGVLGMYLLLDEPNHIVTTIYMLNQEPERRKFQTLPEYAKLRDHFLKAYSGCIRANLNTIK